MNKEDIEELLKDRLKDHNKPEDQTFREYFVKNFKQKLADEDAYQDIRKAADLYKKIGEEIKVLHEHYRKALQEVKVRLRKELKQTKKFNWLQHLHNDSLEHFDEVRLEEIINFFLEDKNLWVEEDMIKHRQIVEKCDRKYSQFRISAYENLQKMLSQVFFKFKRISPLQESLGSSKQSFNLKGFSETCFFAITDGGKKASIRKKDTGELENGQEKSFECELDAACIVEPTQVLLREKDKETVKIWDTVGNQLNEIEVNAKTINKIKVLSNDLIAFSNHNQSKVSLMKFNVEGKPEYFQNDLDVSEQGKDGMELLNDSSVLDFTQVQHNGQIYLAVSYTSCEVNLFQLKGQDEEHPRVRTFQRNSGNQTITLLQLNENQLASGGDENDQSIQIWNLSDDTTPLPSQLFKGHIGQIFQLQMLTPFILVSASRDNTVRLWNIRSGTKLREFRLHKQINDFICLQDTIIISSQSGVFYRIF